MMKAEYRPIALDLIDVPENRLREIVPHRVEILSKDIAANGLLQPIGVVEEASGRFTLVFGLHRLEACRALKRHEIDARLAPIGTKPQELRVQEIMENLDREGLTMLQRAENLAELKRVHEELYPETKHGGDHKSQAAKNKGENQKEIFSFRSDAAERTGLSLRAINIAVAIVSGLAEDIKARLRGTWLADHQAGLRLLSEQPSDMQAKVCDLLFSTPPQAANVGEAIVLAEGRRPPSARDRLFRATADNLQRVGATGRATLFASYEDEIRDFARARGWL